MNLELQFKVIFYSFIYGMFFFFTLKLLKLIKLKKNKYRFFVELLFFMSHTTLFYYLLYKINNGIINTYIFILFILGMFFCHFLYFGDKKSWNNIILNSIIKI